MKRELAIELSNLKKITNYDAKLEQYQTESEIAADILWNAYLSGDVKDKVIADFGCGNGIFGIGALLLGAKKVYFIDIDEEAIKITKQNLKELKLKGSIFFGDVENFNKKVDVVLENPPFGVQERKADKKFLLKSFEVANKIYSFHKIESGGFMKKISSEHNFRIVGIKKIKFRLRKTMKHHKKEKYDVDVGIWVLERE